jgi:hypothetical protein
MAYSIGGSNPGPAGDYFDDAPAGAAPKMEEKEESTKGETGILPKSLMGGKEFKPGEEIVLKVVAVHENDFEVEYSHDESKEEQGSEPPMEPAGAPGGGMEEMMS